jgi:pre-mRNA-splicing helicase BRR2
MNPRDNKESKDAVSYSLNIKTSSYKDRDRERGTGGNKNEPTGEPDTLTGKYKNFNSKGRNIPKFGDRAAREKPSTDMPKKQAIKEKPTSNIYNPKKKTKLLDTHHQANIYEFDVGEQLIYRPKTKETQNVYEDLLSLVHHYMPDQDQNVLKGALDDILAIIKTEGKDSEKLSYVEAIIGRISPEEFNKLYQLSKGLVDYTIDDRMDEEEQINVALGLDEEASEDEEDMEEGVQDVDDVEAEAFEEQGAGIKIDEDVRDQEEESNTLIGRIDGFWLQNQIRQYFDDSQVLKLEEDIMGIISLPDKRECENKLVLLLSQERFTFIKDLIQYKFAIYHLTRLGQAQDENEKTAILQEMANNPEGQQVLRALEISKNRKEKDSLSKNSKKKDTETLFQDKLISEDVMKSINRSQLDLESLKFTQGSHFMSNKGCELPKGSFRLTKKGYEEIFIPPVIHKSKDEKEIPIDEIPEWMHRAFQAQDKNGEIHYTTTKFNRVQSKVLQTALYSDENMLICAPTSSGKTNIALLSILRLISKHRRDNGYIDLSGFKIVYIAPMKALVKETVGNFSQKLSSFGVNVKELSGDINLTKKEINETHVIITTPEKWDIITRKAGERAFTELVKLIIIDEIHLLHDTRGAVLEAIVARTIRKIEKTNENVRLVALSATLPNYEDVGAFLQVDNKIGLFYFDSSYRPIPLEQRYIGITEKKSIKRMLLMNEIAYEKVAERAGKKQIIIFVHSRRETLRTAKTIKEMATTNDIISRFTNESRAIEYKAILNEDLPNIKDNELKELLPFGIAIHHAGLSRGDREIVEDYFNDGLVQLIVSTATLAWGVNLPAHTVIIKGTQIYDPEKGNWVELSPQDVLQMMGRAGRFGYGQNVGEGIIVTSHHELQFYLSLLNQQLPIESQMISSLPDSLNAEIVAGTISNLKDAVNWLSYSYLYIRMLKKPSVYGISEDESNRDPFLVQRRTDLIHTAANILDKHGLIKYDRRTNVFQPTALGKVSSYYYIKYQSMAIYNENLRPNVSIIDIFRLFSLSNEFKQIPIREEEKQEINKLMVKVPIPIKGSMEEPASKINVLLQAYISQFKLEGYALASDMVYISQSAGRIFRALFEICLKRNWAALALTTLNICKMVEKRMWSAMTPLRQFKGIQEDILYKIERKEQLTWDRFYDMTAEQIGELIKLPKQGKALHRLIRTFPRLELEAAIQPQTRSSMFVELAITPDFIWDDKYHGTSETFYIIVEDNDSEVILHSETFILKKKHSKQDHRVSFIVPMIEPIPPQYFIRVVSDRWLNCERLLPISFRHTILPEKFPPHTSLLDLQPLLFKMLRYPEAEAHYKNFPHMYPIQTQTFKALYETDESVFIGAPTGSGKTLCAEFALLRYLRQKYSGFKAPAIYVCSIEAVVLDKYKHWSISFKSLGYTVGLLTGQLSLDNKIFDSSDIVMTTPDKLDMLTRRWKRKDNIQAINLVIVDEIHLLGESGSILEVVLSRLRFMESQLEKNIRYIALGTSLANPTHLADWLNINPNNVFNFNPHVRPNKLEVFITGFDQVNRKLRLLAMSKPLYTAIKTHSEKKPVMIYVSDRKQAKIRALDLLTLSVMDDKPDYFKRVDLNSIADVLKDISDSTLKHTLRHGVGFIHNGMTSIDKGLVIELYSKNLIQVLILTHNVCWEINLFCHLVVIYDPMKYDGMENRWTDYSIPDMLQILGRASLTSSDPVRKCLLLCQTSKKEYYKKFLYESFPLESHLNHFLNDHLNAEIVSGTIENYQNCMDWLTWTYMYRRLKMNPNYYDVPGKTDLHINDYLSELIERTLTDLRGANCVSIEGDSITPLNYARIAVFYYIKYNTIDLFSRGLNQETNRIRHLLEILTNAYEFEDIPIRNGEEDLLRELARSITLEIKNEIYNEPHTKANILLQCYFSREPIPVDLVKDQKQVVEYAQRLSLAMVDVLSSNGLLKQALIAMEISQMIVQAMWITQSPLLQLPYFTNELIEKCREAEIEDISDIMNMEDDKRQDLLNFSQDKLKKLAEVCNRYPYITLEKNILEVERKDETYVVDASQELQVKVHLEREYDLPILTPVHSLYYPNVSLLFNFKEKEEAWWIIIGEKDSNTLLAIKRFTFVRDFDITLKINAPDNSGTYKYSLYLFCDSWVGCDQEEILQLYVP